MDNQAQWYKATGTKQCNIFDTPALRHKVTGEAGIFGKRGEVWIDSELYGTFAVLVRSGSVTAGKVAALAGKSTNFKGSDEFIVRQLPKKLLEPVLKLLGVPKNVGRQVAYVPGKGQ